MTNMIKRLGIKTKSCEPGVPSQINGEDITIRLRNDWGIGSTKVTIDGSTKTWILSSPNRNSDGYMTLRSSIKNKDRFFKEEKWANDYIDIGGKNYVKFRIGTPIRFEDNLRRAFNAMNGAVKVAMVDKASQYPNLVGARTKVFHEEPYNVTEKIEEPMMFVVKDEEVVESHDELSEIKRDLRILLGQARLARDILTRVIDKYANIDKENR